MAAQQTAMNQVWRTGVRKRKHSRSVSGMELVMEELVEVMVLMEGLRPYTGYAPVIAAVWDTQAAGSIGRIGSPERKHTEETVLAKYFILRQIYMENIR